jgi:hypothetical protein
MERNNMDTTQEFISMIKAASLPWEWKVGDWMWSSGNEKVLIAYSFGIRDDGKKHIHAVTEYGMNYTVLVSEDTIPIPRLDQLAEMLKGTGFCLKQGLTEPVFYCPFGEIYDSPEKALLCNYMGVCKNKSWNGKEWL